jgi:hypothetical protein
VMSTNYVITDFTSTPISYLKKKMSSVFQNKKQKQISIIDYARIQTPANNKKIFALYQHFVHRNFLLYPLYTFAEFSAIFLMKKTSPPFNLYCLVDKLPNQVSPIIIGYFIAMKQSYQIAESDASNTKKEVKTFDISNLFYDRRYPATDLFCPTVWNKWADQVQKQENIHMIGWMEHQNLSNDLHFWKQHAGNSCNWYMFHHYSAILPNQMIALF